MTYETRYRTAIITVSLFSMYVIIVWLADLFRSPVGVPIGLLTSFGLYRLIAALFQALFANFKTARKLLAGPEYLEGTWVGILGEKSENTEQQLVVEYYRQTPTSLNVTGHSYSLGGLKIADWHSISSYYDVASQKLSFFYLCNDIGDIKTCEGIAVLSSRGASQNSPPTALSGYSTDTHNGVRTPTDEIKISDEFIDQESAIEHARRHMENIA